MAVYCFKDCYDLLQKKSSNNRENICKFFEITRTIYSNNERSEQFLKDNTF